MFKAYKYRIYPSENQKTLIAKHIGCCRFIYNWALDMRIQEYRENNVSLSGFDIMKMLPHLKMQNTWLKEVNSQSLQHSIANTDIAFKNFFRATCGFPKFKKKLNRGSFSVYQKMQIKNNLLFIPKFKAGIAIVMHRELSGEIKQITISKTPTGKFFASVLVYIDTATVPLYKVDETTTIGIDLGIKSFVTKSNGGIVENPKYLLRSLKKIKYVQRRCSRRKGKKYILKLASLHERIANQRADFLNKVSTILIRENQSIAIENLNIRGMVKNHPIAMAVSDCGWGLFINMLEYKAKWQGVNILKIGRFEPTSKMCSVCGSINKELALKDRIWTCNTCNSILDRDVNAAINIKAIAIRDYLNGGHILKNQRKLPTSVGAMTSEIQATKHVARVVHKDTKN